MRGVLAAGDGTERWCASHSLNSCRPTAHVFDQIQLEACERVLGDLKVGLFLDEHHGMPKPPGESGISMML